MLDVRRLQVLRKVAALGSFSKAAEALSFTPSAVSQQIARLEGEVGTRLVDRSPLGVSLTDAGGALVHRTEAIFIEMIRAEAELEAIAGRESTALRVGSFPTAAAALLPEALSEFAERHPEVELRLTEVEPEEGVVRLRNGTLDVAVVFEYDLVPRPAWNDIERVHLLDDPLSLVLPAGHRLAGQRSLAFGDLTHEPWIAGTPADACSELLRVVCRRGGFEPDVAIESNDYSAIQSLVAAGAGVALMPRLALETVKGGVTFASLGPETPVRRIRAAVLAEGHRSFAAVAMLSLLREVTERHRVPAIRLARAV
jgi:DNA-binding transcriptional LysR family regulator